MMWIICKEIVLQNILLIKGGFLLSEYCHRICGNMCTCARGQYQG
jgi:hypothetical protein